jgi:hypothetical protein
MGKITVIIPLEKSTDSRNEMLSIGGITSMRAYIVGTSEDVAIDTNGYATIIVED